MKMGTIGKKPQRTVGNLLLTKVWLISFPVCAASAASLAEVQDQLLKAAYFSVQPMPSHGHMPSCVPVAPGPQQG